MFRLTCCVRFPNPPKLDNPIISAGKFHESLAVMVARMANLKRAERRMVAVLGVAGVEGIFHLALTSLVIRTKPNAFNALSLGSRCPFIQ